MIPWAHASPQPKVNLDRFSRFCTDDCRVSLYFQWDAISPSKLPLLMGDLDPHVIHDSRWPTEVLSPNGISIGAAVFARLTGVTDRQTDR